MERGQMWGNDLGLVSPLCELSLLWREGPGTTATERGRNKDYQGSLIPR